MVRPQGEFSSENSRERLVGAPPGYVGHEAGGELTNAVRQNQFVVLVFDEIEKAHPQVLDLFLQILEDGRLVDGHGMATDFSQSIVIFMSNLGVAGSDPISGRIGQAVMPGLPYPELEARIRLVIVEYFSKK